MNNPKIRSCPNRPWLLIAIVAACLALAGAGCQTTPKPPSENVRAKLGTIGIAPGCAFTNFIVRKPIGKGVSTAAGAGCGAFEGLAFGAQAGSGGGELGAAVAILVWMVAVPVGAGIGAAKGHAAGATKAELTQADETEQQLRLAVLEADLHGTLCNQLYRAMTNRTTRKVFLPASIRTPPSEGATGNSTLAEDGFDTLLEATCRSVGLTGTRSQDAPLTLCMRIDVRLIRARDNHEWYKRSWNYYGITQTLTQWGTREGQGFRAELLAALPSLADQIIEELFLRYEPP